MTGRLTLFPMRTGEKLKVGLKRLFWGKRRKVSLTLLALVLVVLILLAGRAWWSRRDVLAVVNHTPVRSEDIVRKVQNYPAGYRQYVRENPRVMLDDYINQHLLYRKARRYSRRYRSVLKPLVQEYYQELLVKEFVERQIVDKIQVTAEEISTYYNTHLNEFAVPEKVRIFEIVVATRENAEDILNRLILGEDFSTVAQRESIGNSKELGGDLGWIEVDKLDPELARVVSRMRPGQILGDVVRTHQGYHIIKLAAETPRSVQTLEEATATIRNIFISQRKREAVEKYIKELREKSRIEIYEKRLDALKEKLP